MRFTCYSEIILDTKELRNIIEGKTNVRKCPDCQGEGQQWFLYHTLTDDPDQDNKQFKHVSAQFAADFDEDNLPPEYSWGKCDLYDCDTCLGVGYLFVDDYEYD